MPNFGNLRIYLVLPIFFIMFACSSPAPKAIIETQDIETAVISWATGFDISDYGEVKVLRFFQKGDTSRVDSLVLYKVPSRIPFRFNCRSVKYPVNSAACLSATHVSFIHKIGMLDKVTGITALDHSFLPELESSVKSGKVKEIAVGGNFKSETLLALNPDVVFISPMKNQSLELLEKSGLLLVPVGEFLETSPLGRAEWIKYVSLFFDAADKAAQVFDSLEMKYLHLKSLTLKIPAENKPAVFSGNLISGVWYLPGGNSYESAFFKDAGARYLWEDNPEPGSIGLGYESVFVRAVKADYWRMVVYTDQDYTYEKMKLEDERYTNFPAFSRRKVFCCNTRHSPLYQVGVLEPHVILADYIFIFHPDLLPGYSPVYYHLLK